MILERKTVNLGVAWMCVQELSSFSSGGGQNLKKEGSEMKNE